MFNFVHMHVCLFPQSSSYFFFKFQSSMNEKSSVPSVVATVFCGFFTILKMAEAEKKYFAEMITRFKVTWTVVELL